MNGVLRPAALPRMVEPFVGFGVHISVGASISDARKERPNEPLNVALERELLRLGQLDTPEGRRTRLYFVQAGMRGPIKIGLADDPRSRLRELQCGNHEQLYLLASFPASVGLERFVHRRLQGVRVRGEWFQADRSLFDLIAELDDIYGEEKP